MAKADRKQKLGMLVGRCKQGEGLEFLTGNPRHPRGEGGHDPRKTPLPPGTAPRKFAAKNAERKTVEEIPVGVAHMWSGGPLRRFSLQAERGKGGWMRYESKNLDSTGCALKGFVGPYVCEVCLKTCTGVYRVGDLWPGGCCRDQARKGRRMAQVRECGFPLREVAKRGTATRTG
jgi:hypothetical protein